MFQKYRIILKHQDRSHVPRDYTKCQSYAWESNPAPSHLKFNSLITKEANMVSEKPNINPRTRMLCPVQALLVVRNYRTNWLIKVYILKNVWKFHKMTLYSHQLKVRKPAEKSAIGRILTASYERLVPKLFRMEQNQRHTDNWSKCFTMSHHNMDVSEVIFALLLYDRSLIWDVSKYHCGCTCMPL